jgi:hypothetical protein
MYAKDTTINMSPWEKEAEPRINNMYAKDTTTNTSLWEKEAEPYSATYMRIPSL